MILDAYSLLDPSAPELPAWLRTLRHRRIFTLAVGVGPDAARRMHDVCDGEALVVVGHTWVSQSRAHEAPPDSAPFIALRAPASPPDTAGRATWSADLAAMIDVAVARDLLVVVDPRGVEDDVVRALRRQAAPRLLVSRYRGPVRAFRRLVELGAYFAVGAADDDAVARDIVATVPSGRLLVATGGGDPERLAEVQRAVASVRGLGVGEVQDLVRANFSALISGEARLGAAWARAADTFTS